jgi:hypothetical protein
MAEMCNNITYTQDRAEKFLRNLIPISNVQLSYNSNYGYGNTPNHFSIDNSDWKELREELFKEYDELWRDLASL